MAEDKDDKLEGHEESEYHFSEDEDLTYEMEESPAETETESEAEAPKPTQQVSIKDRAIAFFNQNRRPILGGAIFLIVLFVVYKMVMPSSPTPPSTQISPIASGPTPNNLPGAQPPGTSSQAGVSANPLVGAYPTTTGPAPSTGGATGTTPGTGQPLPGATTPPLATSGTSQQTAGPGQTAASVSTPGTTTPGTLPSGTPGTMTPGTLPSGTPGTVNQLNQVTTQTESSNLPPGIGPVNGVNAQAPGTTVTGIAGTLPSGVQSGVPSGTTSPSAVQPGSQALQNVPGVQQIPGVQAVPGSPALAAPGQTVTQTTTQTGPGFSQTTTTSASPVPGQPMQTGTISERLNSVEQQSQQLNMQYGEKLASANAQNAALQAKIQDLNNRMGGIEASLNQLTQVLVQRQVAARPRVVKTEVHVPYVVQAIIPGRAWLKSECGDTVTVAEGDVLKGIGRITKIDPYDGIVVIDTGYKSVTLTYGATG